VFSACQLAYDVNDLGRCRDGACNDGGSAQGEAGSEASSNIDAGPDAATRFSYRSCLDAKQAGVAVNGFVLIDPDMTGPLAPFDAWCDMTTDGGGWMLVTEAMVEREVQTNVMLEQRADDRGGMVRRVYPTTFGCGSQAVPQQLIVIRDTPRWTRVRFRQRFGGTTACWAIFGRPGGGGAPDPNLIPFDSPVDTLRDAVGMGGIAGDAFSGQLTRCDNEDSNFWRYMPTRVRSAQVILRREPGVSSGLATSAECGDTTPGSQARVYWEYSDVFVQ
jgi:hypothetical protein